MDWTEMYQRELGIDPTDRHQLLIAVTKDIVAASHGDQAAKRRVRAYDRAQRAFDQRVEAEEREAAAWAGDDEVRCNACEEVLPRPQMGDAVQLQCLLCETAWHDACWPTNDYAVCQVCGAETMRPRHPR